MTSAPDSPPQIVAFSLRALVCILYAGGSILPGCFAVVKMLKIPGSSFPALNVSLAVMMSAMFLMMANPALRWFCFLCSGRLPRSSRLWSRGLTWLLAASCAAVLVCLFCFA